MKKVYNKDILIGIAAIILYFVLNIIQSLPFDILGINTKTLPMAVKTIYIMVYETMIICIMILLFNKKLIRDFKDILLNHKQLYSKYLKYWLIGVMVMIISNSINIFILGGGMANNEETIRELFKQTPIYIYLSSIIFAPIVEELVFRQGIRNIFGRNILFVLVSGLIFGGLHVLTSMSTPFDLLYIIPYSSLGLAFAYMLYKTDNIFVSMGFHFMHNGILISLQFLLLLFY